MSGLKWYAYDQNNSGGYFISNDVVAEYVLIQAATPDDADEKMLELTQDYNEYCPCCGERWWIDSHYSDGYDVPSIYGTPITDEFKPYERDGFAWLYYADGRKERFERNA